MKQSSFFLILCLGILNFHGIAQAGATGPSSPFSTGAQSARFRCSKCGKALYLCPTCHKYHHVQGAGGNPLPSIQGPFPNNISSDRVGQFQGNQDSQGAGSAGRRGHRAGSNVISRGIANVANSFMDGFAKINLPDSGLLPGTGQVGKVNGTSGLVPPNKDGNPGWQYSILAGVVGNIASFFNCQATLIDATDGVCRAATAAHCLVDAKLPKLAKTVLGGMATYVGTAVMRTTEGEVNVTRYVNPEYIENKRLDSAVMAWRCPNGPGSMKVVPISKTPLVEKETVYYGKVMGMAGAFLANIFREPGVTSVDYLRIGEGSEHARMDPNHVITQGDSGGPLFKIINGVKYLVGVLATSDDLTKRRPLGTYSTNLAMDYIAHISRSLGSDK